VTTSEHALEGNSLNGGCYRGPRYCTDLEKLSRRASVHGTTEACSGLLSGRGTSRHIHQRDDRDDALSSERKLRIHHQIVQSNDTTV
jgi:hypothetical protein